MSLTAAADRGQAVSPVIRRVCLFVAGGPTRAATRTLNDALRNASNVVFKIRGFAAAAVVDGVEMPGYFPAQESLVDVERIDVIKGVAGDRSGSSPGGRAPTPLGQLSA